VRVDVPLADASKVGVGVRAEITVEALPGRTLQGEVTRIVNEADLAKNTLQFKVRIIDAPDGLKPEMLARVRFLARAAAATSSSGPTTISGGSHLPFVPDALVKRDGAIAFVLIADRAAGVARQRAVTVGDQLQDGWVVVTSGLGAGDSIIAEPTDIRDGTRIRIVGEAIFSHGKAGG
jgi:multidrug efflux pump subunit AcrA (membrane-fusion protein)